MLGLPVAFAVSWSQVNGVKHFDLGQSWIKPIAPGESVGESLTLDRIHRRKLLPGASDNHAVYSEKWQTNKTALSLFDPGSASLARDSNGARLRTGHTPVGDPHCTRARTSTG